MTTEQASEIIGHLLAIRTLLALLLGAVLAGCLWRKY